MEKLKAALGESENLSFATADVEKPETLREALQNARGVIFAASGRGYFSAAKVDHKVRRGCGPRRRVYVQLSGSQGLGFAYVAKRVVIDVSGSGYF